MSDTKHSDAVILEALAYIEQNNALGDKSRLKGGDPKKIQALLADQHVYEVVGRIVESTLAPAVEAQKNSPGAKRNMTYVAGGLGSYGMMDAAVRDGANDKPAMKELRGLRTSSVVSDFQVYKRDFFEATGESHKQPYANIRPLMNGINVVVRDEAEKKKLNIVLDDTLIPNAGRESDVNDRVKAEGRDANVRVFAVALTPEQAKTQAAKSGIDPSEAEKSAKAFHANFSKLADSVSNITLVDKDMNVIYRKENGKAVQEDKAKMHVWDMAFDGGDKGLKMTKAPEHATRGDLGGFSTATAAIPKGSNEHTV